VIDSHIATVYKHEIYTFGGFITSSNPHYSNALYNLDTTDITYKRVPCTGQAPPPRTDHSGILIQPSSLVVFGGMGPNNEYLDDINVLDMSSFRWSTLLPLGERPSARVGHAMVGYHEYVFVLGGHEEASKKETKLYCIDVKNDRNWRRFKDKFSQAEEEELELTLAEKRTAEMIKSQNNSPTFKKYNKQRSTSPDRKDGRGNSRSRSPDNQAKDVPQSKSIRSSHDPGHLILNSFGPVTPARKSTGTTGPKPPDSPLLGNKPPDAIGAFSLQASNLKQSLSPESHTNKFATAELLKQERIKKKKAMEKRRLLGEFEGHQIPDKDIVDKDIIMMQSVLASLAPEREKLGQHSPDRTNKFVNHSGSRVMSHQLSQTHNASIITSSSPPKTKPKMMRPGVSMFSEKIGSRLEPVGLPHLDGLSLTLESSRVFIFGGDRSGLSSNDLFVVDLVDLMHKNI
jgi:Kelch motif